MSGGDEDRRPRPPGKGSAAEPQPAQRRARLSRWRRDPRLLGLLTAGGERWGAQQIGGLEGLYALAGYPQWGAEPAGLYRLLYARSDVAGRVVDLPAATAWRAAPDVMGAWEDAAAPSEFTTAWRALADRLGVWEACQRADRLARLGRFSVLLIGVRGLGGPDALAEPLGVLGGPDDVLYLRPYGEPDVEVAEWETAPGEPNFGRPRRYRLRLGAAEAVGLEEPVLVHHTRLIHVVNDPVDDPVYGAPVLQRVLNRLIDLEKVLASTAEGYWKAASRILVARLAPEAEAEEEDLEALGEDMEYLVAELRRWFVAQGVDLQWLSVEPPNPGPAVEVLQKLIAAGAGIPQRILYGSETGERASEQDERQWLGTVDERRKLHCEPRILRPLIDRLVRHGGLPLPPGGQYVVVWPELRVLSERELAEANRIRAETARALTPVGGDPLDLVEVDEARNVWLVPRRARAAEEAEAGAGAWTEEQEEEEEEEGEGEGGEP